MIEYSVVFFFLGAFNLVRLAWEDLKTLHVDVRINYLMIGVVLTLFFLEGRILEMIVVGIFFGVALSWLKQQKWLTGLEDGDMSILGWVIPGLWFLSYWLVAWFYLFFVGTLLVTRYVWKSDKGFPVSGLICVAFCLTWCLVLLL